MLLAIEVLKKQIEVCDNMAEYYQKHLAEFYNSQTADASEKMRLEAKQDLNQKVKQSCLKAIDELKKC